MHQSAHYLDALYGVIWWKKPNTVSDTKQWTEKEHGMINQLSKVT